MSSKAWIAGAAAVALTASLAATSASAQHWSGGVYVAPSQYVYPVAPQRVWVPGHWEWNGYRNVWVPGHYIHTHPVYGPPYGGRHWRDRDHDGIPNRYDRDRDGDGVPNRHDRRPNDPWRR